MNHDARNHELKKTEITLAVVAYKSTSAVYKRRSLETICCHANGQATVSLILRKHKLSWKIRRQKKNFVGHVRVVAKTSYQLSHFRPSVRTAVTLSVSPHWADFRKI